MLTSIANLMSSIFPSILSTYLFVILVRVFGYLQVKKHLGVYKHNPNDNDDKRKFTISSSFSIYSLLNPIQSFTIKINRSGDQGAWEANLLSDLFNFHHFQGIYTIENKETGGVDGCMDIYFHTQEKKIAIHLHYLRDNKWHESDGYYIFKSASS